MNESLKHSEHTTPPTMTYLKVRSNPIQSNLSIATVDTRRQETSPNRHSHSHHHDRHERQGQVVSPTRLTQRAASTNQAPSTSPLPTQGTYSLLSHLREQAPTSHPTPAPYTQNLTSSYFLKKQLHSCRIYVLRPTQLERTPRTAKHTAHTAQLAIMTETTLTPPSTLDPLPTPHGVPAAAPLPCTLPLHSH